MDAALIYTFNAFAVPLLMIATLYIGFRTFTILTGRRAMQPKNPGPARSRHALDVRAEQGTGQTFNSETGGN